jgi:dienelactone hydrolase
MKKILSLFLIFSVLFSLAQSKKEAGNEFIKNLFVEKNVEKAHTFFDSSIAGQVSTTDLKSLADQLEGQLGDLKNILEVNNEKDTYYFYSEFSKTKLDIQITFNDNNKIIGFYFTPHKIFDKEDDKTALKIKSDDIELKGTLLQPTENNQKKLVILVHGSGPQDRDETIGENKPFKDIAEYLLKNGISSYRYDKRTYSNPETFNDQSTVEQETINDAVNASNYFKYNDSFKGCQIIILGHSQGAYLMPKIAEKAQVSKYVFMAGNARPLQNILVEQYEYLHKINPSNVSEKDVQNMKKQVDFLNSNKFNLNTPKSDLPLEQSAAYWKYLVDYKPLEAVKSIKAPMFFAQGGRDYQVTEKDFTLWKNQLKNNKSAEFKFYPALSHLFIKGSGMPSPKDYEIKGNVDEEFLKDLTQFILK